MSILPINTAPSAESADFTDNDARASLRPVVAAFLSALVPGTGQFLLGERRKRVVFFGSLIAIVLGFWPLRLPRSYVAFMILSWCCIGLFLYAAFSPIWSAVVSHSLRPSRWWLAAMIPITLVALCFWAMLVHVRLFTIPSTSMEPTIRQGDRIMVDMNYYTSAFPRDQKAIIFKRSGTFFIKRVIAHGGELVSGKGSLISVNGQVLNDPTHNTSTNLNSG
jgi:Signal peptidase, peptidase S26